MAELVNQFISKSGNMFSNEKAADLADDIAKVYSEIRQAKEHLKQLRTQCKHTDVFQGETTYDRKLYGVRGEDEFGSWIY